MRLFDDYIRTDTKPSKRNTPDFEYLNNSARFLERIFREQFEKWFAHFPESDKKDLRERFRSKDNVQHRSAFFELYLHELFSRMGYRLERHPAIQGVSVHPDYKVEGHNKVFYLEATSVFPPKDEQSANAIVNQFYDDLDDLELPDFFIAIKEIQGKPDAMPSAAKLRKQISKWAKDYDYEKLVEEIRHNKGALLAICPLLGEWKITIELIPKKPEKRGISQNRSVVLIQGAAKLNTLTGSIRTAVEGKAKKLGKPDIPLVIAINVNSLFFDIDYAIDALFGEPVSIWSPTSVRYERKRNGALIGPTGPRNTYVSAVIIANNDPWNLSKPPCLIHNPWASHLLEQRFWELPEIKVTNEGEFELIKESAEVTKLLNLPQPWPPKEQKGSGNG